LFFDASDLVQYVFIFWVKNPAAVNEDFWSHLVSLWIAGFSFVFNFTYFFITKRLPTNYYICIARLPVLDWSLPSYFAAHLEVLTIFTIIIIKLKIQYFRSNQKEGHMTKRSIFLKKFSMEAINKSSITSFSTNLTCLLFVSTFVFFGLKLNQMTLSQLNEYPNYLYVYIYQLILPSLVGFIIVGLFYSKNAAMKQCIMLELKKQF
jgi:hypothetical protein